MMVVILTYLEEKAQIEAGTYEVNYDALADKILTSEF